MFLSILSGRAKDYFVYNINRNLIFAEIYNQIKRKFDTKVNKAQYHINWSLMMYFPLKTDKSNIGKTNLEVLQALLNKLQLCQRALRLGYIGKNNLLPLLRGHVMEFLSSNLPYLLLQQFLKNFLPSFNHLS